MSKVTLGEVMILEGMSPIAISIFRYGYDRMIEEISYRFYIMQDKLFYIADKENSQLLEKPLWGRDTRFSGDLLDKLAEEYSGVGNYYLIRGYKEVNKYMMARELLK